MDGHGHARADGDGQASVSIKNFDAAETATAERAQQRASPLHHNSHPPPALQAVSAVRLTRT
jgi:hypothetical protein